MTPVPHEQQTLRSPHTSCDDFIPAQINSTTIN